MDAGHFGEGRRLVILVIDNYDSFTYNLVQCLRTVDRSLDIEVVLNDRSTVEEIEARQPSHLLISPGPGTPDDAGVSLECVRRFAGRIPLLGVCLGHQAIAQSFGGKIVPARPMHGKVVAIHHDGSALFDGLPNPFEAMRYNSLLVRPDTLGDELIACAWSHAPDGTREIMGLRHRRLPLFGVQFHPESFLTPAGPKLLERFLATGAAGP